MHFQESNTVVHGGQLPRKNQSFSDLPGSRGHLRPTPTSFFLVFHSGSGMRKIVFQVIQYKPFQILVESLWEKCLPQASLFSISGSERVSRYQDLNGSTNCCFCVWLRIPHSFVRRLRVVKQRWDTIVQIPDSEWKTISRDSGVGRKSGRQFD